MYEPAIREKEDMKGIWLNIPGSIGVSRMVVARLLPR